jgi:hypothetical protein
MSYVASLELCRELYELSGWQGTGDYFGVEQKKDIVTENLIMRGNRIIVAPAYDLGYLLRKLCRHNHFVVNLMDLQNRWVADAGGFGTGQADTPEDAACKLAIELFKQGVLSPQLDDAVNTRNLSIVPTQPLKQGPPL